MQPDKNTKLSDAIFLLSQSDEEFFIFTCLYKPILYYINIVLLCAFILDIL